jgi:hypothetical protein
MKGDGYKLNQYHDRAVLRDLVGEKNDLIENMIGETCDRRKKELHSF